MDAVERRHRGERTTAIEIIHSVGEHGSVSFEGGTGYGGHPSLIGLQPGEEIELEYLGRTTGWGGQIVGARRPGGPWLYRKTAEDLIAAHAASVADGERRAREALAEGREAWQRREDALPEWLRARLATFHERGGETFALSGWAYELTICEVAVLLEQTDLDDDAPSVMAYAREHGTTGNQHGMARALARAHRSDPAWSAGATVSALSPLTGDADYSGGR